MHPYTTDADDRASAASIAFVLAVLLAYAVHALSEALGLPGWLVSAPSAPAIYLGLLRVYDTRVWKQQLIFWRNHPPDIAGNWEGTITPSEPYSDDDQRLPMTATIRQDRTRISVRMEFSKSHSESISAELRTVETDRSGLTYLYRSSPVAGRADSDMAMHTGAAWLRLTDPETLAGDYYNSPPRLRAGHIELHRLPGSNTRP